MQPINRMLPQDFKDGIKRDAWAYIEKLHKHIDQLEKRYDKLNSKFMILEFHTLKERGQVDA